MKGPDYKIKLWSEAKRDKRTAKYSFVGFKFSSLKKNSQ